MQLPYIFMDWEVWPVLAQNIPAERLDLAMKAQFEARTLKAKVKPANAGKE